MVGHGIFMNKFLIQQQHILIRPPFLNTVMPTRPFPGIFENPRASQSVTGLCQLSRISLAPHFRFLADVGKLAVSALI